MAPPDGIHVWAGSRTEYGFTDGIGDAARFRRIRGMDWKPASDPYIYVCDFGNRSLRRIDWRTAEVETIYTWSSPDAPYSCTVDNDTGQVGICVFDDNYTVEPNSNTPLAESGALHRLWTYDPGTDTMTDRCAIRQWHHMDWDNGDTSTGNGRGYVAGGTAYEGVRWQSDSRASRVPIGTWSEYRYDDLPAPTPDADDEPVFGPFDEHLLILPGFQGGWWIRRWFSASVGNQIKCWNLTPGAAGEYWPIFESEDAHITDGLFANGGPIEWKREYDGGSETGYAWWLMEPSGSNDSPLLTKWFHDTSGYIQGTGSATPSGHGDPVDTIGHVEDNAYFEHQRLRSFAFPEGSVPYISVSGNTDAGGGHFIGYPDERGWTVGQVGGI